MLFTEWLNPTEVLYWFRKSIATVKANYTYLDSNDDFEREPYVVHFHVSQAGIPGNITLYTLCLFHPLLDTFIYLLCFCAN